MKNKDEIPEDELVKVMQAAVAYFESAELPSAIQLSQHETIVNVKKFVDSHLIFLRSNWNKKDLRRPYLVRFLNAYDLISTNTYEQPSIKALEKRSAVSFGSPIQKKPAKKAPAAKRRK